jgi:chemosensory pili system protein ChpC
MTAATQFTTRYTGAAAVANEPAELPCVLLPLQGGQLLLPSVCVAEIIPWRRVQALDGAPDWCLGLLDWRGETVPVIRFERLNVASGPCPPRGRCLVVMNRTGAEIRAPFYALAVEGLPRLVQLADGDLTDLEAATGRAESRGVRIGTEAASIPDLAFVEQQVAVLIADGFDSAAAAEPQLQPQP